MNQTEQQKPIAGILVTMVAPFENHIANGGEKLFGNAGSIKRRPDGKVYVSGQMQRHVFFSSIDRLNSLDADRGNTFVSNGDGITQEIERDIRADLGGFMYPSKGNYSGRRISPLSVTPAVALSDSKVGRDLLVRIKVDPQADSQTQAFATKEYSESDKMCMNFHLDISAVGASRVYDYVKVYDYKGGLNIGSKFIKHITEEEKRRRISLFLDATRLMNDYANQARNAVCGEPERVLIVFDTILSRKASRYFTVSEQEQKNILKELDRRGVVYFMGDDSSEESVADAYEQALAYLKKANLVDFATNDKPMTFAETFGSTTEEDNPKKKTQRSKTKKTSSRED